MCEILPVCRLHNTVMESKRTTEPQNKQGLFVMQTFDAEPVHIFRFAPWMHHFDRGERWNANVLCCRHDYGEINAEIVHFKAVHLSNTNGQFGSDFVLSRLEKKQQWQIVIYFTEACRSEE